MMARPRTLLHLITLLSASVSLFGEQATVRVEPSQFRGPRPLQKQTEAAVVHDYLQSWQSMSEAMDQNRAGLLDTDFVGTARDKLADTVNQQASIGIHTRYQDHAHHIRILFYSPEGLSIQLEDKVEYEQQVMDHEKTLATQRIVARYLVVLTPTENRWRVRVLQGGTD